MSATDVDRKEGDEPEAEVAAPRKLRLERQRPEDEEDDRRSPPVDFRTLAAAVAVTAALFGWIKTDMAATQSRLDAISARLDGIPTRGELGDAIDQAAALQRAEYSAEAARVRALADTTQQSVQSLQERVDRRMDLLDTRIANLGTDFSGALIEYLRTGRQGAVISGVDGQGGADGAEEAYRDYAIRLAVRDADMSVDQAIRFVDRALLNPRGEEGLRLMELAAQARVRNRGVVSN